MMKASVVLTLVLTAFVASAGPDKPFLHGLFTDAMILQRDVPCPVWGWAAPGAEVAVKLDGQQAVTARADANGRWLAKIGPQRAGGPHTLTLTGPQTATLRNVLFGDVWICSGQSNMEMGIDGVNQWWNELPGQPVDGIRLYWVKPVSGFAPEANVTGGWSVASSQSLLGKKKPFTSVGFSAIAWLFGRRVHQQTGVPVGLIECAQGNTSIQPWSTLASLRQDPEYGTALDPMAYFEHKLTEWAKTSDPAFAQSVAWQSPGFDDRAWPELTLPQDWSKNALPGFSGLVWFRRTVTVPADWEGAGLRLSLGRVENHSAVWVNGTFVGGEDGYQRTHVFPVPGALVKAGPLVITARVLGSRGFVGTPEEMTLGRADGAGTVLSLSGPWKYQASTPKAKLTGRDRQYDRIWVPAGLFHGMVAPLTPFAIKGVLWYQGEGNAGQPSYEQKLTALIQDWRAAFGQGDFPFYLVQLAGFGPLPAVPGNSSWALTREIQARVASTVPNSGVAVAIDRGELRDIHPPNKRDVAERLAAVALAKAYRMDVPCEGPTYASMAVERDTVRLSFTHAAGLKSLGSAPAGFAIAGADRRFYWAQARLDGENVIVSAPEVKEPVAVRYGWGDNALCNLYNQWDLPAVPFRTDTW